MLVRLLPAAALLILPLLGRAQVSELSRDKSGNLNGGYELVPSELSEIQGSPFLLNFWSPATLRLAGSSQAMPATLKYDLYRQELRAKRPASDSVLVPLAKVQEFSLASAGATRRFVCYPTASLPPEVGGACAEVLQDGAHAQLLKFWRKTLVKQPGESNGYASGRTVSALQDQIIYYLRYPADGRLVPLKLKRASLEQAFAGQVPALAALKARKGGLNSEADMAAALAAIDPLLGAAH